MFLYVFFLFCVCGGGGGEGGGRKSNLLFTITRNFFSMLFFSGLVFLVSCVFVLCIVPSVACTSGLSIFDCPFGTY